MKRLSVECAMAASAALAWLGAACAPTSFARSDRADAQTPEATIQAKPASAEWDAPAPALDANPEIVEAAPPADQAAARASRVGDPATQASPAGETQVRSIGSKPEIGFAPVAATTPGVAAQAPSPVVASVPNPTLPELMRLDRGPGEVPLWIPRAETLVFEVHLNLGWLGSPGVGKVTMSSEVRPFYSDRIGQAAGEQAFLSGRAEGSYKVYTLDSTISSALLPQAWPRVVHRNVQTGTENRARELLFGVQNGKDVSRSRNDSHCRGCKDKAHFVSGTWPWEDDEHCKKCRRGEHRVWKEPKTRDVPAGSLDMMTAVFLARSMVIDGRDRIQFPLVDKHDLWMLQLTRGKTKTIETAAGKFNAVAIELATSAPDKAPVGEETKFEGLFGIHGTISIWMEANSGVPVRIDGTVPVGPIELDATVELHSARGTPHAFAVLR